METRQPPPTLPSYLPVTSTPGVDLPSQSGNKTPLPPVKVSSGSSTHYLWDSVVSAGTQFVHGIGQGIGTAAKVFTLVTLPLRAFGNTTTPASTGSLETPAPFGQAPAQTLLPASQPGHVRFLDDLVREVAPYVGDIFTLGVANYYGRPDRLTTDDCKSTSAALSGLSQLAQNNRTIAVFRGVSLVDDSLSKIVSTETFVTYNGFSYMTFGCPANLTSEVSTARTQLPNLLLGLYDSLVTSGDGHERVGRDVLDTTTEVRPHSYTPLLLMTDTTEQRRRDSFYSSPQPPLADMIEQEAQQQGGWVCELPLRHGGRAVAYAPPTLQAERAFGQLRFSDDDKACVVYRLPTPHPTQTPTQTPPEDTDSGWETSPEARFLLGGLGSIAVGITWAYLDARRRGLIGGGVPGGPGGVPGGVPGGAPGGVPGGVPGGPGLAPGGGPGIPGGVLVVPGGHGLLAQNVGGAAQGDGDPAARPDPPVASEDESEDEIPDTKSDNKRFRPRGDSEVELATYRYERKNQSDDDEDHVPGAMPANERSGTPVDGSQSSAGEGSHLLEH